jgi:hypothetical protein
LVVLAAAAAIVTFALWAVREKATSSKAVMASPAPVLSFAATRVSEAPQPWRLPREWCGFRAGNSPWAQIIRPI